MKLSLLLILLLFPFSIEASTKYTQQCPETTPTSPVVADLQKELGPIRSQDGTPWCATYTSTTLAEHHYYKKTGKKKNFSVLDMNAGDSKQFTKPSDLTNTSRLVNLNEGSSPATILEGLQQTGGVYLEADLPFDQSSPMRRAYEKGLIKNLAQFYQGVNKEEEKLNNLCPDEEMKLISKTMDINTLKDIARKCSSEDEFMSVVARSDKFKITYPQKPREKIPPYNVVMKQRAIDDEDSHIEDIMRALKAGKPATISLCFNHLMNILDTQTQYSNDCGAHSMIIAGAKNENGRCKVLIRNSHGTSWPFAEGDPNNHPGNGYQWIDIGTMLTASAQLPGENRHITYLEDREENAPVQNHIEYLNGRSYTGSTWSITPHGQGELSINGEKVSSGEHEGFNLVNGFAHKMSLVSGNIYSGEIKDRKLHGQGKILDPNGSTIYEGQFINGTYTSTR